MPGKLSWALQLEGLDEVLAKLTTMESKMHAMSGRTLGTGGVNTGSSGGGNVGRAAISNTAYLPYAATRGGTGSGMGAAVGAGMGAAVGSAASKHIASELSTVENMVKSMGLSPEASASLIQASQNSPHAQRLRREHTPPPLPKSVTDRKEFVDKINEMVPHHFQWLNKLAIPKVTLPKLSATVEGGGFGSKNGKLKLGYEPGSITKGVPGEGVGGLAAKLAGGAGMAGLLATITIGLVAFHAALHAARFAIEQMAEAIARGTELYHNAARSGHSVGSTYGAQTAFGAAGIEPGQLEHLMAQGQFGSGGRVNFDDLVFGARKAGDKALLQQIMNMGPVIKSIMEDPWTRMASEMHAKMAPDFAEISLQTFKMKEAWHTMWSELAFTFTDVIRPVIWLMRETFRGIARIMAVLNSNMGRMFSQGLAQGSTGPLGALFTLMSRLGVILREDMPTDFSRQTIGGGGYLVGHAEPGGTGWEKMGLIIGMGGVRDQYARDTATNTRRTATGIEALVRHVTGATWTQAVPSGHSAP